MNMKKYFSFLIIVCLVLFSCNKEEPKQEDKKATITIEKPFVEQVYNLGDTVFISGTASFDADLHGYNVMLLNTKTNMNVLSQGYHVHGKVLNFNEKWVNTVTDTTELNVIIQVAVDHDGTLQSVERKIVCLPN